MKTNIKEYCIPVSDETQRRMSLELFEQAIQPTKDYLLAKGCSVALVKIITNGKIKFVLCRKPDENDIFTTCKRKLIKIAPPEVVFESFQKELKIATVLWEERK